MSSVTQNQKKINSAFDRLVQRKDVVIPNGLEELLDAAMEYSLEVIHPQEFLDPIHTTTDDSYGWGVFHDGALVRYRFNDANGDEMYGDVSGFGNAPDALVFDISNRIPKTGWVGVLVAGEYIWGVHGGYSDEKEIEILHWTADFTREMFNQCFKRLK